MLASLNSIYSKTDFEILKEFAKMLKQRRINNNLTQQELADAIGISMNHLSRIERTGKTTLAILIAISRKLKLLQQLLDVYKNPELTPIQKFEIEQKTAKIKAPRKRVKK